MKKLLFIFASSVILGSAVVISTSPALADHTVPHTIQQLQEQLKALQAQLTALQVAAKSAAVTPPSGEEKELVSKIRGFSKQITQLGKQLKTTTAESLKAELRKVAKERRKVYETLLEKNPKEAIASVLPPSISQTMSEDVKADVEQLVTFSGQIEVLHLDNYKMSTEENRYFVRSGKDRVRLYIAGDSIEVRSGAKVSVNGFRLGDTLLAADGGIQIILPPPPIDSIGDQKTLVVLVRYLNSPATPPFTVLQAKQLVFAGQAQSFFNEASYGKISWSGDVVGWYTVQRNTSSFGDSVRFYDPDPDGIFNYIKSQNIDLRNYERVLFLDDNHFLSGGYSSVGRYEIILGGQSYILSVTWVGFLSQYAGDSVWGKMPFPWTNLDKLLSHELGHGLGLWHANLWQCDKAIIYGDCSHVEYGNPFDTMGSHPSYALHYNAKYKELLGWLDGSILSVSQSGAYTLNPLESSTGTRGLKIQSSSTSPFYIEYRRPIGFDQNLNDPFLLLNQNGVMVNWVTPVVANMTRLLDMTPDDWVGTVALSGQNIFQDTGRGVTLGPVLSVNPDNVTVNIAVQDPICVRSQPAITTQPWYILSEPDATHFLSVSVLSIDSDTCSPANFEVSFELPTGWGLNYNDPSPVALSPGYSLWKSAEITVPAGTAPGSYRVFVHAKNITSAQERIYPLEVYVPSHASFILLSPNGGEKWAQGSGQIVTWQSLNVAPEATVNISLQRIDAQGYYLENYILAQSTNDGTEQVIIPENAALGTYRIRIYAHVQRVGFTEEISDESDALFGIISYGTTQPFITVLSPNGGEQWAIGSTQLITWSSSNVPSGATVAIDALAENGPLYPIGPLGKISAATGQYSWFIDPAYPAGTYRVKISCVSGDPKTIVSSCGTDQSDAPFNITALKSNFFKNDLKAQDIVLDKLNDYSIMDFNLFDDGLTIIYGKVDTFAFKVLSGLRQLGYSGWERIPPRTTDNIGNAAYRPGLRLLNRFQKDNGLLVTHLITRETLTKLDSLLAQREILEIQEAIKLAIYSDLINGPQNFPSKDHLAFLYIRALSALPPHLRMMDPTRLLFFAEFYYPRKVYPADPWWPKILDRLYYWYSGIDAPIELAEIPNDLDPMSALLHEVGHFISAPYAIKGVIEPALVNPENFFQISWEKFYDGGIEYWKPKSDVNFGSDFVSGYAGAEIGYLISVNLYNPKEYPRHLEDFAESFSLYVLQGKVFRDKAAESKILKQKYEWLKNNVFEGIEYDTGDPNWRSSLFSGTSIGNGVVADTVAGNVPFYSSQNPNFVWNYQFPFTVGTTTPSITVLSPNGGETWQMGQTYQIKWDSTNLSSSSPIYIVLRDSRCGGSFTEEGCSVNNNIQIAATINSGSYDYNVPYSMADFNGGLWGGISTYQILIQEQDIIQNKWFTDQSDASFSIIKSVTAPIAHWKFDEGSGTTTADSSGNGNNGTLTNGPVWVAGKSGQALSFDKVNDMVTTEVAKAFANLPALTVSAWINPKSAGENGRGRIIDKAGSTNPENGWVFGLTNYNGGIQLEFVVGYSGSSSLFRRSAANSVKPNQWQYVTAVWDGTNSSAGIHFYLNGVEMAYAGGRSGTLPRDDDAFQSLKIGNAALPSRTFDGSIDEVRVYNRVLTQAEIQKDMGEISASLTLTAPNGGEKWQIGSSHTVRWTPYDPNTGVNPAWDVSAYLEKLENGVYVKVGRIIESGKASIHWIGDLDTYGNYAQPGVYYVSITNNKTGEFDRSDNAFTLVPPDYLKADLKVNNSDGPITVPPTGADYPAVWSSNTEQCQIINETLPYSDPGWSLKDLPPSGDILLHLEPNNENYLKSIYLLCNSTKAVEGSVSDQVYVSGTSVPQVTIISPNGGESIEWNGTSTVTWTSSNADKISIALYRNDAFHAWIVNDLPIGEKGLYFWDPSKVISQADLGSGAIFKMYAMVYKTIGGSAEDKSDAPFSIVESGVAPIAHWKFDEGSGATALDSSGNGNTGNLLNGPVWVAGKSGQALSFDKVNDTVTTELAKAFANLPALTVSAWINPKSAGENGRGRIIDKASSTNPENGWVFGLTNYNGGIQLQFTVGYSGSSSLSRRSAANSVKPNQWQYVAAVWDGTNSPAGVHLYLNGVEMAYAGGGSGTLPRDDDAFESLRIGNAKLPSRTFDGAIDDVKVFNRTLTLQEVNQVMQEGAASPNNLQLARENKNNALLADILVSFMSIVNDFQQMLAVLSLPQ